MKSERWKQVEQLYHAALERAPDERAAFLADACAGDPDLRREVEELLGYDGASESFIQGNALAFEARRLEPEELSQPGIQLYRDRASEHTKSWRCWAVAGWV